MATNVRTYKITFGALYNGNELCKNAHIELLNSENVNIQCIDEVKNIYQVQVTEGLADSCLTFKVECKDDDCGGCEAQIVKKCFCDTSEDCGDCESCTEEGFCEQDCPPELCINGTCTNCDSPDDCPCNQVCINGDCGCPTGTTLNPATGCCDECVLDSDCDNCDICKKVHGAGTCIPKECSGGVPDPKTCECVDCVRTSDCTGDNECCVDKECVCCPGYTRVGGICVPFECEEEEDCSGCKLCVDYECVDPVCPPGQSLDKSDCECRDNCGDGCPDGEGCLDGVCVPCDELTCVGDLSECVRAEGCDCVNGNCEDVDCDTSGDCAEWVATPAQFIPGDTNVDPGLPAIVFTTNFQDLGIVQIGGGQGAFRDYRITVSTGSGQIGQWAVEGGYQTTGSSITFTLSQAGPAQWNNVGFEVTFAEQGGTGRTGSIVIYNQNYYDVDPSSPSDSFFGTLMTNPANWVVDVQSNAISPGTSSGTVIPGSLKLCACNPNAVVKSYTWTTTEGNLTVKLYPIAGSQCANAVIQGCGTGTGTVTIDCAGIISTVPMPELPYDYSAANCCDPITDPECPTDGGDGDSCDTYDTVAGSIAIVPYNYTTGGQGVYMGVLQEVPELGLGPVDYIRSKRQFCWSYTGNVSAYSSDGTLVPPQFNNLFKVFSFGGGSGCLRVGYSCDLLFPGCKKLQAEACLTSCDDFSVKLVLDGNTVTAVPSYANDSIKYTWGTNDPTFTLPVGNTLTLPDPNLTISSVSAKVDITVNSDKCSATDSLSIVKEVRPDISTPTYSCSGGLKFNDSGGVTYKGELDQNLANGVKLPEDLGYQIRAFDQFGLVETFSVDIPACYSCPDCTEDPSGEYSSVADCNNACPNCDQIFDANVSFSCENNAAKVVIVINSGTGPYSYSVKSNGVLADSGTFSGTSKTITGIPQGNILVNVADQSTGCDEDEQRTLKNCVNCVEGDGTVNITSWDTSELCSGLLTFQVSSSTPSPTPFTVKIFPTGSTTAVATTTTNGVSGSFSGLSLSNGTYNLVATDANGCVSAPTQFIADCVSAICGQYDVELNFADFPTAVGDDVELEITWSSSFPLPNGALMYFERQESPAGCNSPNQPWIQINAVGAINPANPGVVDVSGDTAGAIAAEAPNAATIDGCYRVRIVFQSQGENCETVITSPYDGTRAPEVDCAICLDAPGAPCNDVTWANDTLTVNYCFENPPLAYSVEIDDPQGTSTFVDGSTEITINSSQYESSGQLLITAPASATSRDVDVIFSTGQLSCDYTCSTTIPACSCAINSPASGTPMVDYDDNTGTLIVTFDAVCGSGDYLVTVDVFANATCTPAPASTLSESISVAPGNETDIQAIFSIPTSGSTQSYNVLIEDTVNGGCTRSVACQLIEACDTCTSQTFAGFPSRPINARVLSVSFLNPVGTSTFNGAGYTDSGDDLGNSANNDLLASDMEAFLDNLDPCGNTSTVTWAQNDFSGSGGTALSVGDVLSYNQPFAGTGSDTIRVDKITITGGATTGPTDYIINENVAIYSGGVPTLVSGAAIKIAEKIQAALDTELIAFSYVVVQFRIFLGDVEVIWEIADADNTIDIDTVAGIQGSETTVGNSTVSQTVSGAGQEAFEVSDFGSVTFTITGSGAVLNYVGYNRSYIGTEGIFFADTSGC